MLYNELFMGERGIRKRKRDSEGLIASEEPKGSRGKQKSWGSVSQTRRVAYFDLGNGVSEGAPNKRGFLLTKGANRKNQILNTVLQRRKLDT